MLSLCLRMAGMRCARVLCLRHTQAQAEYLNLNPSNACRDPEEDKEDEEGGEEVADTGFGGGGFTTGGGDDGYGGGGGFGEWAAVSGQLAVGIVSICMASSLSTDAL